MNKNQWTDNAVIYHIFPLGLCGAPKWNEGTKTADSRILKLLDWIPHIKDLGCNAVLFGPIFQSLSHGYDISNYYETDSRLGSKEEFQKVFNALHESGIKIMLDGVFNHVGRGFWAFNDLQQKCNESEYRNWFANVNFDQTSPCGDNFSYEMWEGNHGLVKLNLKNEKICNHLLDAVKMWIEDFDIDGLRLDAADCVDMDFFRKLHTFTKQIKPDFWLMGEIIHGDYNDWANEEMLDSTTNYECWKGIYSSHNDKNYFEIAYSLNRQFGEEGIYRNLNLYNFLDNHDVNRIATQLSNTKDLKNTYTLMFTMPGVPSIYYGSEFAITGEKRGGENGDDEIRSALNLTELNNKPSELITHIKKLAELKKTNKALQVGNYKELLIRNEQFVFVREIDDDYTIVCLNCSERPENLNFMYNNRNYQFLVQPHSSLVFPKAVAR